jgi:penicillin-binding protein 2
MLVVGLLGLGLFVLAGKTAHLTVLKGDKLLDEAQSRLVRLNFFPTVRGQIEDRKGRVLAHDRPSFDVAVDYRVMTGEWVERQAAARARIDRGKDWSKLSRELRTQLIEDAKPAYRAAVDRMWNVLAEETGRSRAEIDGKRMEVSEQVRAMSNYVRRIRAERELREFAQNHGITELEIERRLADLDRPDLETTEELLREVLAQEITIEAERRIDKASNIELSEERMPRVIVPEVGDEVGFRLRRLARQNDPNDETIPYLPGLFVLDSGQRDYPLNTIDVEIDRSILPGPLAAAEHRVVTVKRVATHILGGVRRRIYREDSEKRDGELTQDPLLAERSIIETPSGTVDRGQYFPGDMVGHRGLERNLESTLRGMRGVSIERIDRDDAIKEHRDFGNNVRLTLDIMLQARIQALLDPELGLARMQTWHHNRERLDPDDPNSPLVMPVGTPLDAAVVVLEVDTGEILSLVSTPTGGDLPADPTEREIYRQTRQPWVNRAVSMPLPPGSIVKALMLCGAHSRGVVGLDERISCTGHFYPHEPNMLRCWIYKQFGTTHDAQFGHTINGAEAIKGSCNIYFYTLGQRLGPKGIVDLYRSIGVGEPLDLHLDQMLSGWLGVQNKPDTLSEGESILMGIGQGPVAWTPVHAADSYATLARGGIKIKPTIIAGGGAPDPVDLGFDPAIVEEALRGLSMVVNDSDGTAHHVQLDSGERFKMFDVPGVDVWGKTGTATAPELQFEGRVIRRGDHSWFVLLCGRGRPQYAIAVVAEYAGSGGRVSGPIANQVIHALVAEGYL